MRHSDVEKKLISTFKSLLQKKPFEQITVQDIIEQASVSRASFYRHYSDKYDLMNSIFVSGFKNIFFDKNIGEYIDGNSIEFFEFIKKNIDYFQTVAKYTGQNCLFDSFFKEFYNYLCAIFLKQASPDALNKDMDYLIRFYAHGNVCILREWIDSGAKEDPVVIFKCMNTSIPDPLKPYVNSDYFN